MGIRTHWKWPMVIGWVWGNLSLEEEKQSEEGRQKLIFCLLNSVFLKMHFHFDGGAYTDGGLHVESIDVFADVGQTHAGSESHVAYLG